MKKSILYVFVVLAILFSALPTSSAYNINGTITRADTMVGLNSVTVTLNTTNTTTTNSTGFFSLANVKNGTFSVVVTVPNDGYALPVASIAGTIDGADNTSTNLNLTLVTPTISGITETSITRTGAVISWTPSISTIGNRIKYTRDSALTNNLVTSSWSNGTASPSFTLAGLDIFNTYYYQLQSYNTNNATYSVTSNGDFKTLAGNPEDEPESYELVSVPQSGQQLPSIVTQVQNQVTKSETGKIIAFVIIIVLFYIVLFGKKKK